MVTKIKASVASRSHAGAKLLLPVFLRPKSIARFLRDRRASLTSKLLFLAAIAYVLWPIDLIPDVAPIIGWLDDIGFATAVLAWIARRISLFDRSVSQTKQGENEARA